MSLTKPKRSLQRHGRNRREGTERQEEGFFRSFIYCFLYVFVFYSLVGRYHLCVKLTSDIYTFALSGERWNALGNIIYNTPSYSKITKKHRGTESWRIKEKSKIPLTHFSCLCVFVVTFHFVFYDACRRLKESYP